jgi:hypothetical protein
LPWIVKFVPLLSDLSITDDVPPRIWTSGTYFINHDVFLSHCRKNQWRYREAVFSGAPHSVERSEVTALCLSASATRVCMLKLDRVPPIEERPLEVRARREHPITKHA